MALAKESILSHPVVWVVVATLIIYTIGKYIWTYYRLRHIKGPWLTGFTDLWLMRKTWRGEAFRELGKLCEEYGPLVRIAPNFIICGDPAEVRRLWSVRSRFDRATWYKGFRLDPPNDCSVSMCDGDNHAAYRAKLAPGV